MTIKVEITLCMFLLKHKLLRGRIYIVKNNEVNLLFFFSNFHPQFWRISWPQHKMNVNEDWHQNDHKTALSRWFIWLYEVIWRHEIALLLHVAHFQTCLNPILQKNKQTKKKTFCRIHILAHYASSQLTALGSHSSQNKFKRHYFHLIMQPTPYQTL